MQGVARSQGRKRKTWQEGVKRAAERRKMRWREIWTAPVDISTSIHAYIHKTR